MNNYWLLETPRVNYPKESVSAMAQSSKRKKRENLDIYAPNITILPSTRRGCRWRKNERFSILVSLKLSPSLRIFLYEGRLRRHLLRSRPPSLYLVSRVWKTLNGFLMILKGRGMRAARRARKVSRAEARERWSNSWYPRYTSLPTTDDGRDYWVVTAETLDPSLSCDTETTRVYNVVLVSRLIPPSKIFGDTEGGSWGFQKLVPWATIFFPSMYSINLLLASLFFDRILTRR